MIRLPWYNRGFGEEAGQVLTHLQRFNWEPP